MKTPFVENSLHVFKIYRLRPIEVWFLGVCSVCLCSVCVRLCVYGYVGLLLKFQKPRFQVFFVRGRKPRIASVSLSSTGQSRGTKGFHVGSRGEGWGDDESAAETERGGRTAAAARGERTPRKRKARDGTKAGVSPTPRDALTKFYTSGIEYAVGFVITVAVFWGEI